MQSEKSKILGRSDEWSALWQVRKVSYQVRVEWSEK